MLFRRLQPPTHRRIVHAQMRRDLGQPVAMLPIGVVDDLALRTPPLKQHAQRRPSGLGLLPRNLAYRAARLMPRDKSFAAQIDLPRDLIPRPRASVPVRDKRAIPLPRDPYPRPELP